MHIQPRFWFFGARKSLSYVHISLDMFHFTYLANSHEVQEFDENKLAEYEYVAVFDFKAPDLTSSELQRMRNALARFMSSKILFVDRDSIEQSENSVLSSNFDDLGELGQKSCYIYIQPLDNLDGDNIQTHYRHEIQPTKNKYGYLDGLNKSLRELRAQLTYKKLLDFPLKFDAPKSGSSCLPNGHIIKKLRKNKGSLRAVITEMKEMKGPSIEKGTLHNMENYRLCDRDSLSIVANFFDVEYESLVLQQVVPNTSYICSLYSKTLMDKDELAETFNVPVYFFDVVENAPILPERVLRFQYYKLSSLLRVIFPRMLDIQISDMIDEVATAQLVQQST